jgi:hypothetical protein
MNDPAPIDRLARRAEDAGGSRAVLRALVAPGLFIGATLFLYLTPAGNALWRWLSG